MNKILITAPARRDIERLLVKSRRSFGETAEDRYRSLVLRALTAVRDDPYGPNTRPMALARPGIRSLHLRSLPSAVSKPRHRLTYIVDAQTVIVLRVLHDRMDFRAALR
ncbi:type II toxin-antitoxin system RelE/ParE family toxin [Brevundimonas sp.]|uniref:type II toxin-antitoxin system RelE/ParE family toxin n=1 Tax=Brevundimonas sp. TaxID=1871086 RepID=UPI0037BFAC31